MTTESPPSLWARFSALAARQPDVAAILAPDRDPLTFAALPGRLEAVRTALARLGIGRGDRVAAALPRGPETAACYLGVASVAAYVPLNPDYQEQEFAGYLARLRPKAIIVPRDDGAAARRAAAAAGIAVLELAVRADHPAGTFDLDGDAAPADARTPEWGAGDDYALVLLTSGSTSRPKIVPLRQRLLVAYADISKELYRLGPDDRCVHVMPMFHGHGLLSSMMVPLLSGSGVACPPAADVESFFDHLDRFRPTWYTAGYAIHRAILDRVEAHRDAVARARLRFIRSGSGRLDPAVMHGMEAAFGAPMVERYGMSESGTLTANRLPPGRRKPGTAGFATCNDVEIMGDDGAILGRNRDGEIVARGPTVFDGYLDDPALNAAAFRNGWFRTGDLGRIDDDGFLTVIGRVKDVINRGGEKIAPLEVEGVLSQHPDVAQICIFAMPHPTLGEQIAAAVVPAAGADPVTVDALYDFGRRSLAAFKLPRRIFVVDRLPLGATGKVQRADVARLCATIADGGEAVGRTPADGLESDIAEIWKSVLRIEAVAADRDFFLAGGDSLSAALLFAGIEAQFGVRLTLSQIFDEGATVAGLARLVAERRGAEPQPDALPPGTIALNRPAPAAPVFALAGRYGTPAGYILLARLLDGRYPVVGLESRGFDGTAAPLTRVEDIAADHVERIRAVQPHGPYFLLGACYAARVAYEVARQLEAAGEPIGLLIMLDPSPPFTNSAGRPRGQVAPPPQAGRAARLARFIATRLALYAREFSQRQGRERLDYVRDKLGMAADILRRRDLFRGDRSEFERSLVVAANLCAGQNYIPGRFGGPTVLCFTRDRDLSADRRYRLDWLQLVPQCGTPFIADGEDSGSMLSAPHVFRLAPEIERWLARAAAPAAPRVVVSA